jgi:tetratricopeptide (TPR) repeat protein
MRLVLSLLLLSGAAFAAPPAKPPAKSQAKPAAPVRAPSLNELFAQLAKAESAEDAKPIEQKIEAHFRVSGSPSIDLLMARATAAQAGSDSKTARKLAEAITQIAPNFSEGWHVRAALEQAAEDDTAALVSLQKVVLLNPRNFNALTELGDMLQDYGDKKAALKLYRQALALDPQLEGAIRRVRELTRSVEGQDI